MERLQDQCQEDIGRNLHFPQGINERIALLTPEIIVIAWDETIEFEQDRLPVPEPSIADRKDNSRDSETPDEEINCNMPPWVNGAPLATDQGEKNDNRIIEQREEYLHTRVLARSHHEAEQWA